MSTTYLKSRFSKPSVLTDSTLILGVKFGLWNKVFTGHLADSLKIVEQRVNESIAKDPDAINALINNKFLKSQDVASKFSRTVMKTAEIIQPHE
tara:strand:- start:46237 stop:46518 length:282 start_codon:yes stop_codon:yes gene_type:complete